MAPNWVSWVLPKPLAWSALAMLFGGFIQEDQVCEFEKAGLKSQRLSNPGEKQPAREIAKSHIR